MRYGQDMNFVDCDQIGEVIGVARYRRAPNVEGFSQSLEIVVRMRSANCAVVGGVNSKEMAVASTIGA